VDIDFELIVVDNASSDGSAEMVVEKYPDVRLIANNDNVGFARANNQAWDVSRGRHFMLLNSDTVVLSDLSGVVTYLDLHESTGVVGCRCLNTDRTIQQNWYDYYPCFMWEILPEIIRYWALHALYRRDPKTAFPTKWVGGQCMTVRRACVENVGKMDESYFMYSEETDWCFRIWQAGWEVHYAPVADVIHFGGQSTRQTSTKMLIELYKSKSRFIRKNLSASQCELFKKGLLTRTFTLRALQGVIGKSERQIQLTELLKAIPGM
jgi:hypothetical protein